MKKRQNITIEILAISAVAIQFLSIIFRKDFTIGGEIFIPILVFFFYKLLLEIAKIICDIIEKFGK